MIAIYTTTNNELAYQSGTKRALFNGKTWAYQARKDGAWFDAKGCWRMPALIAKVKAELGK